ncbi:TetR/AcrR family transcriptional regulator [Kineococcus rhizosphaerae]|uniref:TetR family transcriptional regulator n=1 Tax=Kineococcus rhizosphaerae TaxID=559628 RepID=A0A2T0R1T9_9ACTN|nr:TetR/AcrR family transcriptional regulator [Kineococcus rhizosphaerae]PRY13529.1 TetR family transcriptional regulator [Kineococcus rhizosphaerae]
MSAARRPRADVARNRALLLAAARDAFTSGEPVVLEAVARAAGVGIGTLYRHFPTREDLAEAVYAAELDAVVEAAPALLAELPPDRALRAWLQRYTEFVATKRGMLQTLRAGWASGRIATPATRERVTAVLGTFLSAGAAAGTLRGDVDPDDVTALMLGVFVPSETRSAEQQDRLLDLVLAAVAVPGPSSSGG